MRASSSNRWVLQPHPPDQNQQGIASDPLLVLAEGVGFEPTVRKRTTVFETAPFDHSGTPPLLILLGFSDCEKCETRQKVTKRSHEA